MSDVSVEEGNTVIICAALSGRFLNTTEDIIVGLSFIDTLLAGTYVMDNGFQQYDWPVW